MPFSLYSPRSARLHDLSWQQRLIIGTLILFNSTLLSLIPFEIGPVTTTMIVEVGVVAMLFPSLVRGFRSLNREARLFIAVCLCMFILDIIHLDGDRLTRLIKYIFNSIYVYVLVTCIFRSTGSITWVRRLHLIPGYAILFWFIILLAAQTEFGLSERIGGNMPPVYLAVLLPICWTQWRNECGGWRVLNGIIILAAFGTEILSASRGGAICLVCASVLVILNNKKDTMRWLPLAMVALLLVGASIYKSAAITQRITEMVNSPKDASAERMRLWKAALLFTREHPWLGGDFRGNSGEYVSKVTWGTDEDMRFQRGQLSSAAAEHNGYLATTAGFGIIVAAFYFAYFLGLGKRLRRASRAISDQYTRDYLRAGLNALLVWSVGMISLHIFLGWDYLLLWGSLECALASKAESRNYESRNLKSGIGRLNSLAVGQSDR